jgi:hypothetical protein
MKKKKKIGKPKISPNGEFHKRKKNFPKYGNTEFTFVCFTGFKSLTKILEGGPAGYLKITYNYLEGEK